MTCEALIVCAACTLASAVLSDGTFAQDIANGLLAAILVVLLFGGAA